MLWLENPQGSAFCSFLFLVFIFGHWLIISQISTPSIGRGYDESLKAGCEILLELYLLNMMMGIGTYGIDEISELVRASCSEIFVLAFF